MPDFFLSREGGGIPLAKRENLFRIKMRDKGIAAKQLGKKRRFFRGSRRQNAFLRAQGKEQTEKMDSTGNRPNFMRIRYLQIYTAAS